MRKSAASPPAPLSFPMRINKYLAHKSMATRRDADELISKGKVFINGRLAILGDKVWADDEVEVKNAGGEKKTRVYFAYHKPRGIITHTPQGGEIDIKSAVSNYKELNDTFPIGRLDKDSSGLIILTNDGRITDRLLNPEYAHEKEYEVATLDELPKDFKKNMESGVIIGDEKTKPCTIEILGKRSFSIILTEGKKHQIRRMCGVFGQSALELRRTRIMNITLGTLKPGAFRPITDTELKKFLGSIGI